MAANRKRSRSQSSKPRGAKASARKAPPSERPQDRDSEYDHDSIRLALVEILHAISSLRRKGELPESAWAMLCEAVVSIGLLVRQETTPAADASTAKPSRKRKPRTRADRRPQRHKA